MTNLASRLQALVLLLLFLSGGSGLPGADVFLFHLNDKAPHTEAHVESADGCAKHAGHCGLGFPAGTGTVLAPSPATPIVHTDDAASAARLLDQLAVTGTSHLGFHSRAPPVYLAAF